MYANYGTGAYSDKPIPSKPKTSIITESKNAFNLWWNLDKVVIGIFKGDLPTSKELGLSSGKKEWKTAPREEPKLGTGYKVVKNSDGSTTHYIGKDIPTPSNMNEDLTLKTNVNDIKIADFADGGIWSIAIALFGVLFFIKLLK